MSHFTVMVCVEGAKKMEEVYERVKTLLAPYQENNMNDCPQKFLSFIDVEDEYRNSFETEATECVKLSDGTLKSKYESEFFVRKELFSSPEFVLPGGADMVSRPFKEVYPSFENFMSVYVGYKEKDPDTGRFGYWENENARWDWFQIGGRWTGHFPILPGIPAFRGSPSLLDDEPNLDQHLADICQVKNLDRSFITTEMTKKASNFWIEWLNYKETKVDKNPPYGVSYTASKLELTKLVKDEKDLLPEEKGRAFQWRDLYPHIQDDRKNWFDVFSDITREEFFQRHLDYFNPVITYAILDKNGWHSAGEMGWFGCSSETPEKYNDFTRGFMGFVDTLDPETWLVVVDCHI